VVTRRLQAERRTRSVRRPKTGVPPNCATQPVTVTLNDLERHNDRRRAILVAAELLVMFCTFSGPVLHENQVLERVRSLYVKRNTQSHLPWLRGLCDPATLHNVEDGGMSSEEIAITVVSEAICSIMDARRIKMPRSAASFGSVYHDHTTAMPVRIASIDYYR